MPEQTYTGGLSDNFKSGGLFASQDVEGQYSPQDHADLDSEVSATYQSLLKGEVNLEEREFAIERVKLYEKYRSDRGEKPYQYSQGVERFRKMKDFELGVGVEQRERFLAGPENVHKTMSPEKAELWKKTWRGQSNQTESMRKAMIVSFISDYTETQGAPATPQQISDNYEGYKNAIMKSVFNVQGEADDSKFYSNASKWLTETTELAQGKDVALSELDKTVEKHFLAGGKAEDILKQAKDEMNKEGLFEPGELDPILVDAIQQKQRFFQGALQPAKEVFDYLKANVDDEGFHEMDDEFKNKLYKLADMPEDQRGKVLYLIDKMSEGEAGEHEGGTLGKLGTSLGRGGKDWANSLMEAFETAGEFRAKADVAGEAMEAGVGQAGYEARKAVVGSDVERSRRVRALRQDLRDKNRILRKVTSDSIAMRGLYQGVEMLPYMAGAIAPGGTGANMMVMGAGVDKELRRSFPTMTPAERGLIGSASGIGMGYVERLGTMSALRPFPKVQALLGKFQLKGTSGVLASRIIGATGTEYLEEGIQEVIPLAIRDVMSAVDEDIPGVSSEDWEKGFRILNLAKGGDPELLAALIPTTILMGGGSTAIDYMGAGKAREILGKYDNAWLAGTSKEKAIEISKEKDPLKAVNMLNSELDSMTDADRMANHKEAKDDISNREREKIRDSGTASEKIALETLEAYEDYVKANVPEVVERDGGFEVVYPEASNKATELFESRPQAEAAVRAAAMDAEQTFDQELTQSAENIQAMRKMGKHLTKAQDGAEIEFDQDLMQAEDVAAQSQEAMDDMLSRIQIALDARGDNRQATVEDFKAARVHGENWLKLKARGTISLIDKGANITAVIEEGSEGFIKDLAFRPEGGPIANLIDKDWLKGEIIQFQENSGRNISGVETVEEMTDEQAIEAWSDLAMGNFWNKRDSEHLPTGLAGMIEALRRFFKTVLDIAGDLIALKKAGKLDADFETLLDQSVGINMDEQVSRIKTEAIAEIAADLGVDEDTATRQVTVEQDAAYMAAVESGDVETQQEMVDAAAHGMQGVFHGGPGGKEGNVVLFSDSVEDSYWRGGKGGLFTLTGKLREVTPGMIQFTSDYYDVSLDEAREMIDPSDIVDSAEAWDDQQFVSDIWLEFEADFMDNGHAFKTQDGAVTFPDGEQMLEVNTDPVTYDNGKPIPLSERFNETDDRITRQVELDADPLLARIRELGARPEAKLMIAERMAAKLEKVRRDTEQRQSSFSRKQEYTQEDIDFIDSEISALDQAFDVDVKSLEIDHEKRKGDIGEDITTQFAHRIEVAADTKKKELTREAKARESERQKAETKRFQLEKRNLREKIKTEKSKLQTEREKVKSKKLKQTSKSDRQKAIDNVGMLEAIVSSLPMEIRGEIGGWQTMAKIGSEKKATEYLVDRIDKVDKVLETYLQEEYSGRIEKQISRGLSRKLKNDPVRKAVIQEDYDREVNEINKVFNMTDDEVDVELTNIETIIAGLEGNDKLTEDEKIKLEDEQDIKQLRILTYAKIKKSKDPRSAGDMASALHQIETFIDEGKALYNEKQEQENREQKIRNTLALKAITGNGSEKFRRDMLNESEKHYRNRIKDFFTGQKSVEGILEYISRFDLGAESFTGFMFEEFSVPVHQSTHAEAEGVANRIHDMEMMVARLNGIDTSAKVFGKENLTWNSKVQDILSKHAILVDSGIMIEERAKSKAITMSRAEAEDIASGVTNKVNDDYSWIELKSKDVQAIKEMVDIDNNKERGAAKQKFKYTIDTKGTKTEQKLSQDTAMFLSMMYSQSDLRPAMQKHGYTDEVMEQFEKFLTGKSKLMRTWLFRKYQDIHPYINEEFVKRFGTHMPNTKGYAPAKSIHSGRQIKEMIDAGHGKQTTTPGFANERIKHFAEPRYDVGAIAAYTSHISDTEHFVNWSSTISKLRKTFMNKNVKEAIEGYHGKVVYKELIKRIDILSDGGNVNAESYVAVDHLRKTFVVSKLSAKWAIALKQWTSIPAYAYDIPVGDMALYTAEFMANPIKNLKEMWELPFVQRRLLKGYERDVKAVLEKGGKGVWTEKAVSKFAGERAGSVAGKLAKKSHQLAEFGMISGALGDIGPILVAGYAARKYHYKKELARTGDEAKAEARGILMFEMITERAQQAANDKDLSRTAMGGSFARLFTMFQTSQRQYGNQLQVSYDAYLGGRNLLDVLRDPKEMKKGSGKRLAKAILITHVILPSLFHFTSVFARNLVKPDEDDEDYITKQWMAMMVLGPYSGLGVASLAAGDLATGYDYSLPIMEWVKELKNGKNRAVKLAEKYIDDDETISAQDVIVVADEVASGVGLAVGKGTMLYDISKNVFASVGVTRNDVERMTMGEVEGQVHDLGKKWNQAKKDFPSNKEDKSDRSHLESRYDKLAEDYAEIQRKYPHVWDEIEIELKAKGKLPRALRDRID